jgi:thiamine pyrophosphate-dependent acetolactate synthase large subunit-like protein
MAVETGTTGNRISTAEYGSDLAVEMLRMLDVPYVALNPGASFRGLHDSFVNFPGGGPEMVQCCHEEIAVAVAMGYARVTGKPMAAALHSMVGLQHGSMAIYNAWCERLPVLVLGGTGPMASENRRNWIDWVHTALVQGNQVRDYVKWDDQPASLADIPTSLLRGYRIAMTEPKGPVYICYDVDLQEKAVPEPMMLPDVSRFAPPLPVAADPDALKEAAKLLAGASWPVIVVDALGRYPETIPALVALAEMLAAPVISTGGYNLPSNHPLNVSARRGEVLRQADVVLALDVADLAGALGTGVVAQYDPSQYISPDAKVIHISLWDLLQHSWAADYERLQPVDLPITAATRLAVPELVEHCRRAIADDRTAAERVAHRRPEVEKIHAAISEQRKAAMERNWASSPISPDRLYGELWQIVKDRPWTFVNGGAGGRGGFETTEPEQMVSGGGASGAGLGSAAGGAIGATLALRDSDRLFISVQGDGDFLYAPSSLWTAANMKLPLLTIVNNNRSYGNDEGHQEHMAITRGRPVENKGIGIYIEDPAPDCSSIANGFGVEGLGLVTDPDKLRPALERAVEIVTKERRPVLVDVLTQRASRWS